MPLYIGKNHGSDAAPVESVFRLAGSDEDALTYALGFLLAHDSNFCRQVIRRCGVRPHESFKSGYSIHLQEVTDRRFGRRDIVIESSGMRIVFEAKIGGAEPTSEQLLKYASEDSLWKKYARRAVIALTQVKLSTTTRENVSSKLSNQGIRFYNVQWHQVIDLVLRHRPSDGSGVSRYLFDEFISYIRRDYQMGYYDAEVLIKDVNPCNARIFKEGWMYVGGSRDRKAPLYFAPYFTRQGATSGISMISRVKDTELVVLANKQDVVPDIVNEQRAEERRERWLHGLAQIRSRAKKEGFLNNEVRLYYLDRPITFRKPPLTKKSLKIKTQIPNGFKLRFDELLMPIPGIDES